MSPVYPNGACLRSHVNSTKIVNAVRCRILIERDVTRRYRGVPLLTCFYDGERHLKHEQGGRSG
jgi:hypothetical protein